VRQVPSAKVRKEPMYEKTCGPEAATPPRQLRPLLAGKQAIPFDLTIFTKPSATPPPSLPQGSSIEHHPTIQNAQPTFSGFGKHSVSSDSIAPVAL
jgi:hypothetical protein